MMVKTTVNLMTESGECTLTFYRTPQEFDKTFTAMQELTGEKNRYAIPLEDGYVDSYDHMINFDDDSSEPNLKVRILNFLTAAGAHPTILKAIQLGIVFVIAASISFV